MTWRLDATALSALLDAREITPLRLLEQSLGRLDAREPVLNVFIHVDRDGPPPRARRRAPAWDRWMGFPCQCKTIFSSPSSVCPLDGAACCSASTYPTARRHLERLRADGAVGSLAGANCEVALYPPPQPRRSTRLSCRADRCGGGPGRGPVPGSLARRDMRECSRCCRAWSCDIGRRVC